MYFSFSVAFLYLLYFQKITPVEELNLPRPPALRSVTYRNVSAAVINEVDTLSVSASSIKLSGSMSLKDVEDKIAELESHYDAGVLSYSEIHVRQSRYVKSTARIAKLQDEIKELDDRKTELDSMKTT